MELPELPMNLLFLLFLVLFVAMGILPAWKRFVGGFRQAMEKWTSAGSGPRVPDAAAPPPAAARHAGLEWNDYEYFVFRRIALAGDKGLTRRQLRDQLHLDPQNIERALAALQRQGLVRPAMPRGFAPRYALDEKGRAIAVEEGYQPRLRSGEGG